MAVYFSMSIQKNGEFTMKTQLKVYDTHPLNCQIPWMQHVVKCTHVFKSLGNIFCKFILHFSWKMYTGDVYVRAAINILEREVDNWLLKAWDS